MAKKSAKSQKAAPTAKAKRGPVPETVKIEGDWQDAIKKSFQKKKPASGWPK